MSAKSSGGELIVAAMQHSGNRERFVGKLDVGVCWLFTGARDSDGYGKFYLTLPTGQTVRAAHRVSYAMLVQELPDDLELDHLCRNRACVNPDHLEPVPGVVNNARGGSFTALRAKATHCSRNHPFDEANTYWSTNANGRPRRRCRICNRKSSRAEAA